MSNIPRVRVVYERPDGCPIELRSTRAEIRTVLELTEEESEQLDSALIFIFQNSQHYREFDLSNRGGPTARAAFARDIESMLNELLTDDFIAKLVILGLRLGHDVVGYCLYRLAANFKDNEKFRLQRHYAKFGKKPPPGGPPGGTSGGSSSSAAGSSSSAAGASSTPQYGLVGYTGA
ncbi:hypothetical protein TWF481_010325 [Arthrobotrys musiformis]|uniref:Uncharacterized protein n=1 Tax=Arthrobotrys musiformis TaxID=47236 RepID=A0AAV9W0E6_9PEZI